MKRIGRYDRSLILWILGVVSILSAALINSPKPDNDYWKNLDMTGAIEGIVEQTLNIGFENSLSELDVNENTSTFQMEIEKGYRIDNQMLDLGLVYQINVDGKFSKEKALRDILNILSNNYLRIRREAMQKASDDKVTSVEESGFVYSESERFSYISKVMVQGDNAWLFVLTFDNTQSEKVRDFLNTISKENEKGVKLS